jgi:hypothetical protein
VKVDLTKKEIEALITRHNTKPYLSAIQKLLRARASGSPMEALDRLRQANMERRRGR